MRCPIRCSMPLYFLSLRQSGSNQKMMAGRCTRKLARLNHCRTNCDTTHRQSMAQRWKIITFFLLLVGAIGCSSKHVRTNLVQLGRTPTPKTIQVFASSSVGGHPMGDDSALHSRVVKAFQKQFPDSRLDESDPDMVVFFTMVDYVPGCLPNCKKFRTYRNWSCEVEVFTVETESKTDTLVFNLDGSTYNPLLNPAADCASQLSKTFRSLVASRIPD